MHLTPKIIASSPQYNCAVGNVTFTLSFSKPIFIGIPTCIFTSMIISYRQIMLLALYIGHNVSSRGVQKGGGGRQPPCKI